MRGLGLRSLAIVLRVGLATALTLTLLGLSLGAEPDKPKEPEKPKPKLGLLVNDEKADKGYTLIASTNSTMTYLVDMEGRVVHSWKSDVSQALSAYLLENGNLLRTGAVKNPPFFGGGTGGRIQEFTWDGQLVWDYTFVTDTLLPNHDICKLPNGNVLMIVWEKKTSKDAIAAGRRPETVGDSNSYLLADCLLEVKPTGKTTGEIVWEWHPFDHLIQDFDDKQANHGDVAAHPELIDLNFGESTIAAMVAKPEELEKLRAIGYVGAAGRRAARPQTDWLHVNSVAYNAEHDQIMMSVFEFSEIWVIDHSTKKAEAAGHSGGKYGKGGDLLYRWGNPRSYRAGAVKDQQLFGQHNAHWIARGRPGEGHVLAFNNGMRRTGGAYSTVDEIVLPVDAKGNYEQTKGKAFGPDKAVWSYAAPKKTDFYAPFISGAQRLGNGDTLICSGTNGTVFEVTPKDEVVWKYVNPTRGDSSPFGGPPGGGAPFGGPPLKLGQILSGFTQGALNLTEEQKKQLEAAEKDLGEKLGKLLTGEQKKRFEERPTGFGPGNIAAPGQLVATAVKERMKLTDDQQKQLADLQKEADGQLDKILKEDQKKRFKDMQNFGRGGFPGGGGPPGGGAPFGGPPKLGQILPAFLQGALNLTDEQKKQLEATEKDLGEKLGKLLTDEQKKRFEERPTGFNPGNIAAPGQLLATAVKERLKLTEDQQKQVADLQKEADGQLDKLLKDDQKKRFKEMQSFGRGGFPGGGGPPGGGPPGGFPGFGGPGGGTGLFRALRYAPDYPGLAGKELKAGKTIEELQATPPKDAPKEPEKK
jgi:hypothetical protein